MDYTRFRPALFPTVVTTLLIVLLLSLGYWQLDRAEQKANTRASFQNTKPIAILTAATVEMDRDLYQYASVVGRYDSGKQFLIDNIVRNGRNGFFVITPIVLAASSEFLLVNRGWVPQDPARRVLPNVSVEDAPRTLHGRVGKLPSAGLKLDSVELGEVSWPSVRLFPDLKELEIALGKPLHNWVLLLDPEAPDGYLRDWTPQGLSPERHLGYAFQWFALALTLLLIFVTMTIRNTRPKHE